MIPEPAKPDTSDAALYKRFVPLTTDTFLSVFVTHGDAVLIEHISYVRRKRPDVIPMTDAQIAEAAWRHAAGLTRG